MLISTFDTNSNYGGDPNSWDFFEDWGIFAYYMMFTWQGWWEYFKQAFIVILTIWNPLYLIVLIYYYYLVSDRKWTW